MSGGGYDENMEGLQGKWDGNTREILRGYRDYIKGI